MSSPHCHSNQRSRFEHTQIGMIITILSKWIYIVIAECSFLDGASVVAHLVVNFKTVFSSPTVDRVDRRPKRLLLLRDRRTVGVCAAALCPGMNVMKSSRWADGFGQILSDCYTVDTDKWERGFVGRAAVKPPRAALDKSRRGEFYRLRPTGGKE